MRYTRQARQDILDIWLTIAPSRLDAADRIVDRIEECCLQLNRFPELGPPRPEIFDGARALVIDRWLAIYMIDSTDPQVVRVVDASRNLTKLSYPRE